MMKMICLLIFTMIIGGNVALAIEFIYQDKKGHYHYKCDATGGGRVVVKLKSDSISTKGGRLPNHHQDGIGFLKHSEYNASQMARAACGETNLYRSEYNALKIKREK
ncbi:hypothetical protein KKA14_17980 [bacterium]|nr:hypothetical protein [bacterium]